MSNYFKILRPGINSTFQDLGRFGLQHLGIVPSGCMDRSLFYLANQLVGNEVFEGVLEFAYQGPLLELESESAEIAIAGKVNFNVIDKNGKIKQGVCNQSFVIYKGEKIDIISTVKSVYGYLSIYGGFKLDKVKESISTLVRAKIGSNDGEKLKLGEKIFYNQIKSANSKKKIEFNFDENNSIRVMKGLQFSYFSKESQKNFFLKEYEITKLTDRMGMRLEGEKLQNVISSNIKSEGITKGSIQVPGDGQPIILLSDHPTIGGYPKIANVITADYDKLVQKAPGIKINFKLVDISIAESAFEEYLKRLNNNLNAIRL